jgi:DNA-binding CsgD family transcriptional regulator
MNAKDNGSMTSLPESDYLAILDLIQKFYDCRTRSDFKHCFQENLLPLINAERANYLWVDSDLSNEYRDSRNIDSVGYQPKYGAALERLPEYMVELRKIITQTNLRVIGTNAGMSRKKLQIEVGSFFMGNPEFQKEDFPDLVNMQEALALVDRSDGMVGVGIQRILPNTQAFTFRDVRVLELLHPHIMQCIKTIYLNEELKKYKALSETLAEVATAMALVSLDHRVIFRNTSFSQVLPLKEGQRLPRDIIDPLKKETSKYNPPFDSGSSTTELSFVKLPQGVFRLVAALLNGQDEQEDQCWLLRLKPAVEPYSRMNLLMQDGGLTGREIEIASLVRDGMDDQEIGDRLFISVHTVKNHVKSIHQKLDVHTRAKLVSVLNSGNNEQNI